MAHGAPTGWGERSRRGSSTARLWSAAAGVSNAGMTARVSSVALRMPPMTTVARGRWISAPGPRANAIGRKPMAAATAVINTGRNRWRALRLAASAREMPWVTSCP